MLKIRPQTREEIRSLEVFTNNPFSDSILCLLIKKTPKQQHRKKLPKAPLTI